MLADEVRKENIENTCFMTLPIWKLVVLSLITFGLYEIVWFYKYWKVIKDSNGEKISPFWRALFAGFSGFWLFPILEKYIKQHNLPAFSGIAIAITYFLLNATYKASDPIWVLSLLTVVILVIVQSKINEINKNYYPHAEISNWTWKTTLYTVLFLIVFLGLVFLYAIVLVIIGQV